MSSTCKFLLIILLRFFWKPTIKFFSEMQSRHENGEGAEPHCSTSTNRRCKVPFLTSGFRFFSMFKYGLNMSSTHLLSGYTSVHLSTALRSQPSTILSASQGTPSRACQRDPWLAYKDHLWGNLVERRWMGCDAGVFSRYFHQELYSEVTEN